MHDSHPTRAEFVRFRYSGLKRNRDGSGSSPISEGEAGNLMGAAYSYSKRSLSSEMITKRKSSKVNGEWVTPPLAFARRSVWSTFPELLPEGRRCTRPLNSPSRMKQQS